VKAGYQAAGFYMHLWVEPQSYLRGGACDEAARKTAHQLGIPFYIVDLEKIFKKKVVDYFLKEYSLGRTPNPCIMCNRFIKFEELMSHAKGLGYDYLATGHYARIVEVTSDQQPVTRKSKNRSPITGYRLLQGVDKAKDQSYFLYNLTQKRLAQVMFPVGNYLKTEVIKMARKWKLPVAERPESQEICFFKESDYRPFLKRQIKKKIIPGDVVDTKGKVIGKHRGLPLYTIGQRHGFRIQSSAIGDQLSVIPPYYVVRKDVKKNQLIVGFGKEAEKKEFLVKDVNWIAPDYQSLITNHQLQCQVRIRHQGELLPAKLSIINYQLSISLNESERGVAPGQAVVFYQGEETLGGGIIATQPGVYLVNTRC